jgi:hypothetical protein
MSGRVCASLIDLPAALEKTGFVLEHHVAEMFRASGWSIIGGRYYADDVDGRARELDLIAYKTFKSGDLTVVYSVLVSCKKDAENTWVFLTRDRPSHDPNYDWDPVHYWTDVNPLEKYLQSERWKDCFLSEAKLAWQPLAPSRDVFAFQQINSKRVVPQNDTAVFNSITTLMKGLDYELLALPQRQKNKRRIYFFSLLSVVDAPLVEVFYSGGSTEVREVDAMTHFARYMVRKREMSALVRFVRSDALEREIKLVEDLAKSTSIYADSAIKASFEAIKTSRSVQDYFSNRLQSRLGWWLGFQLGKYRLDHDSVKISSIDYSQGTLKLMVEGAGEDALAFLNGDDETLEKTKAALKQLARFEGKFEFVWDIPF